MKVYFVFLQLTILAKTVVADSTNPRSLFDDHFNKTFECVRNVLEKGSSDHGLPSFSPLKLNESVEIHTNNIYLMTDVVLDRLVIDGLADYIATKINLEPNSDMYVDFVFPKITLSGLYSGRMNILGLYAVYGNGDLTMEITNLNALSIVKHNSLMPLIANVNTTLRVDKIAITVSDLMGDADFSKLFSQLASYTSTWFVNNYQETVSEYLNPIFQQRISSVIGKFNFLDYLAHVISYSCI